MEAENARMLADALDAIESAHVHLKMARDQSDAALEAAGDKYREARTQMAKAMAAISAEETDSAGQ